VKRHLAFRALLDAAGDVVTMARPGFDGGEHQQFCAALLHLTGASEE
jgi:hypothetical protein